MFGLILGDIAGSMYEFKNTLNLQLTVYDSIMNSKSRFTDDTVMACAIAKAIRSVDKDADEATLKEAFINNMKDLGRKYVSAGYGKRMKAWILSDSAEPYGSYANGSAMRVFEIGRHYNTLERVLEVAQWSSEVTHNHPDAIAAARAVAGCVFLARTGSTKQQIKEFAEKELGDCLEDYNGMIFMYPYSSLDISAKCTVPVAIDCFLNSDEDGVIPVIEEAINRGGDTDTIASIAGGIADAYYNGLEAESYYNIIIEKLPEDLADIASNL